MAIKFLEPGGDATFNVANTINGGMWGSLFISPAVATDFVHGNHIKSIKYRPNNFDGVTTPASIISDSGARISFYIYLVTLPNANSVFAYTADVGANIVIGLSLTSSGVLQLTKNYSTQIGVNGPALSTGKWYRICLAYTITSSSVNEIRLYVDGTLGISVTNASLSLTSSSRFSIENSGNDGINPNSVLDFRSSDHYIDDSKSLTDTGDIWVTAKRPNANGTTNGFTTQIGSGGSGYGSGHSSQVNERALSTTNGWSMVGAGSAVTEEYNIENRGTGDFSILNTKIVGYVGWAYMSSLAGETVQFILNGVNTGQAITSTNTMYTIVSGSASYPSGTGTDIGITTDTSLTTVSLFECGIIVAFIPTNGRAFIQNKLRPRVFKPGLGR